MSSIQYTISNKKHRIGHLKFAIGRYLTFPKGFTLIELVLVIAVLSIISLMVIMALNPIEQLKKANDGRRKSDLSELQKALEIYYQDNGRYPDATDDWIEWGDNRQAYISADPVDPGSSRKYAYGTDTDGQMYGIFASLERGENDPQACNDECSYSQFDGLSESDCRAPSVATGNECNYGVTSPNTSPVQQSVTP